MEYRSIGPSIYRTLFNNRSIGPSVYRTLLLEKGPIDRGKNRSIEPSDYRTLFMTEE